MLGRVGSADNSCLVLGQDGGRLEEARKRKERTSSGWREGELCGLSDGACRLNPAVLTCMNHQGGFIPHGAYDLAAGAVNPLDGGIVDTVAATSSTFAHFE